MNSAHIQLLKDNYANACNAYVKALASMWELDTDAYGYWIADCVGEVYAYGDWLFIGIDDIIFCVENDIKKEQYDEWIAYCEFANEFGLTTPNLKAWCKGCPRLNKQQQKRIIDAKKAFDDAVEEYKKDEKKVF